MRTLIFLTALSLLPACTQLQGLSGELTTKAGQIKVLPDGRVEVVVDPSSGK